MANATALEMVQRMQRKLRLPVSTVVTQAHAAIMLECLNTAQRSLLTDGVVWDELKVYGSFATEDDEALYTISGTVEGDELEIIRNLQIDGYEPLIKKSDSEFRELRQSYLNSPGQPLYYRHYSRVDGSIIIEVTPTPDAAYTIKTEALKKPAKLVADDDEITLDEDTLFLAAMFLATDAEGLDYQTALSMYQAKFSLMSNNQGESNWGDVEVI